MVNTYCAALPAGVSQMSRCGARERDSCTQLVQSTRSVSRLSSTTRDMHVGGRCLPSRSAQSWHCDGVKRHTAEVGERRPGGAGRGEGGRDYLQHG